MEFSISPSVFDLMLRTTCYDLRHECDLEWGVYKIVIGEKYNINIIIAPTYWDREQSVVVVIACHPPPLHEMISL